VRITRIAYLIIIACLGLALGPLTLPAPAHCQPRELVVGFYQFPPLFFKTDAGATGLYIELIRELARAKGWKISFRPDSWDNCIRRLENGEITVLVAMTYSPARVRRYFFSRVALPPNGMHLVAARGKGEWAIKAFDEFITQLRTEPGSAYFKALTRWLPDYPHQGPILVSRQQLVLGGMGLLAVGVVVVGVLLVYSRRKSGELAEKNLQLEREIAERKSVEKALRESERRFRTLVETMNDGLDVFDLFGRFTYVNPRFCEIVGYSAEELIGKHYSLFMDEANAKKMAEQLKGRQQGQESPYEIQWRRSDGSTRLTRMSPRVLRDAEGRVTGSFAVVTDITAQREAEEAIKASERLYRSVMEASPDPIAVYDMQGRVLYINPAFTRVFGWSLEEVRGRLIPGHVPEESYEQARKMRRYIMAGLDFSEAETRLRAKDGRIIPVSVNASVITDEATGKPEKCVVVLRDIRQQKMLEAQLRQAQKMEAIGVLASGIAHDFNNLLQAVVGYLHLLREHLGNDPEALTYLESIEEMSNRGAELVKRLLAFGREDETRSFGLVRLQELVEDVCAILRRTFPREIRIETHIPEELWPVKGDPALLKQVLMNLASNARDAMPEGGRLIMEAYNMDLDLDTARNHPTLEPGKYVVLSVADTGIGMDAQTLERIFEPFFTTKEVGKGSGLGLFTTYGIIKSHKGEIYCTSTPGQGTVFRIYLPASDQLATSLSPQHRPGPEESIEGKGELVVVVDDEPAVLGLCKELLKSHGYRVVGAERGEDALEIIRTRGAEVELVILDWGLPGIGGRKTLEELLTIAPNLKVIVASGYTGGEEQRQALALGARRFVGKPYKLKTLLKAIREVLDEDQPES